MKSHPGMNNKVMMIFQGIPGSGKSTIAEAVRLAIFNKDPDTRNVRLHSADQYRMIDGLYVWDRNTEGEVWRKHHCDVRKSAERGITTIIVDNTNLNYRQTRFYFDLADEHGYDVEVVRVEVTLEVALNRNGCRSADRAVPSEQVMRMHGAMQDLF